MTGQRDEIDARLGRMAAAELRPYTGKRPPFTAAANLVAALGLREFPAAVPHPLMAMLTAWCVGVTESRPPNQIIGRAGSPYIDRWYLARKGKVPRICMAPEYEDTAPLMASELENVYLHGYHRGDADEPHDHPWPNASLVVRGWYRENVYDSAGTLLRDAVRQPGDIVLRSAGSIHAILETSHDCLSLFATLPKERDWGFWTRDGHVPWREFQPEKRQATVRE